MTSPYGWHDDPLDVHGACDLDPASQWILGHGSDFDAIYLERHREAFQHLLAIQNNYVPLPASPDADWNKNTEVIHVAPGASAYRTACDAAQTMVMPAPLRNASVAPRGHTYQEPRWSDPTDLTPDKVVVVAVIDDAINMAHARFRHRHTDGRIRTRVDYAWIQDAPHNGTDPVPYGREWVRRDIDRAIAAYPEDDEAALAALGIIDFASDDPPHLAKRFGHGTHVLDLAAGAPAHVNMVDTRIITVQIPKVVTRDTSGYQYCAVVVSALEYVMHRARTIGVQLGKPVSLVVNFSYGVSAARHDGGQFVARAFDLMSADYRRLTDRACVVVIPSGNRNLSRGHAVAEAARHGPTTLTMPWRVPPGDTTSSYLEIWMPDGTTPDLTITTPGGTPHTIALGSAKVLARNGHGAGVLPKSIVARVSVNDDVPWGSRGPTLKRILIALSPTEPWPEDRDAAPNGVWTVEVSATIAAGERLEAWIQRDDTPLGHRRLGEQSYFDDPDYVRFDHMGRPLAVDPVPPGSVVRRSGAFNGLATGRGTVVVGGYVMREYEPRMADYSGTSGAGMRDPNFAQVSDRSLIRQGVRVAGVRSGSQLSLNGTSVAAPHAARQLVDGVRASTNPATFDPIAYLNGLLTVPPFLPSQPSRSGDGALKVHPGLEDAVV
ncbi:MAG: S8 family serine peptidase [Devosia sp.]